MKIRLLSFIILAVCFTTFNNTFAQCTTNYLKNPSFELPIQTNLGNNYPVTISDWTMVGGNSNLVKTNGVADYYGGPNNASNGSQYLDIVNATATAEQSFTTVCNSILTFSGDFSSREGGNIWTAKIEIVNSSNVVVATSSTRNFTTADADISLPQGPDAIWYTVSGTSISIPPGTYTYRVFLDDFANFDNAFLCATPGCVLPVKLKDFSIADNNCKPLLTWNTTQEVNCKQYEIEMSENGASFSKIATIGAKNDFYINNYSFLHNNTSSNITYYRLKIIDNDGQFKYSSVLRYENKCDVDYFFNVFPNPINDKININYFDSKQLQAEAKVYSADGKLMIKSNLKNGLTIINASQLSKGVYYIAVTNGVNKQTKKMIKE